MLITALISVLLGFILGCIIMKYARPAAIPHGPNSNYIKRMTFFDESTQQCYKFVPKPHVCPLYLLKK